MEEVLQIQMETNLLGFIEGQTLSSTSLHAKLNLTLNEPI